MRGVISKSGGNASLAETEDSPGFDPQGFEEWMPSRFGDFFHLPKVLFKNASEARERSMQALMGKGLYYEGCVEFLSQLNETNDKAREEFKRRFWKTLGEEG